MSHIVDRNISIQNHHQICKNQGYYITDLNYQIDRKQQVFAIRKIQKKEHQTD